MLYSEHPHDPQAQLPQRDDGSVAFERLIPEHRRAYLDGWGAASIGLAAPERSGTSERFFKLGVVEARGHAAQARG